MFKILEAKFLGPGVKQFEIHAPRIAKKQLAGQFVIVRLHEHGERIPLTIAGSNPERGTITLIVQGDRQDHPLMNCSGAGDAILDVVGPLGRPRKSRRSAPWW